MALTISGTSVNPGSWSAAVQGGLQGISSGTTTAPPGLTKEEAKAALSDIQQTQTPQGVAQPQGIQSLKQFEQAPGGAQAEFLNKIQPSQVQSQARTADQAQMAAAIGLGTTGVPADVSSRYAESQAFREKRAAQVEAGAKGTDVSYPSGVKSPLYSENVSSAMTKGGNVFIGGVGGYEFKAPPTSTSQLQAPSASNPLFTVGASQYQPSPMMPKQSVVDVQVPTAFGFVGGIPDVSGRGKPVTMRETGIVIGQTTSQPFGISQTVHGGYAPPEIKQTILMKDMGTTTIEKSRPEAWQNYAADVKVKQEKEIQNTVASYAARGIAITPYTMEDTSGQTWTMFGNEKRDYSLLPATPSERTQRLLTPFEEAGAKANTGNIIGALVPAASFVNLGLPEGKKLEYKSPTFKIATDLALSGIGMVGKEGAKLTAGSYYRLAPIEVTKAQMQDKSWLPSYKQLAASQLESGRTESAVNIAVIGAFEIGGAALAKPGKAGMEYISSIAKGEAREGVFNPRFITKDSVVQYIPDRPGIFNRVGSNIITENPASMTTRVISSKAIEKLPGAIGTSKGIFTDITEGAAIKLKRTTTIYSTEGTSVGSFTTGYSVKGDIYGQKGSLTAGMGDLANVEQNMIFIPKKGDAKFYKFTNTGTAQTSMSIPIEGFGVGRTSISNFKTTADFSTATVFGQKVSQPEVAAAFNPTTGAYELKGANVELGITGGNRESLGYLIEASRYKGIEGSYKVPTAISKGLSGKYAYGRYIVEKPSNIEGKAFVESDIGSHTGITLKHEFTHDVFSRGLNSDGRTEVFKAAMQEYKAGSRLPENAYGRLNRVMGIISKDNKMYNVYMSDKLGRYDAEGYSTELLSRVVAGQQKPKTVRFAEIAKVVEEGYFQKPNKNVISTITSNIPIEEYGFKTFGTIKTPEGKPVAMVEYFSKNEPKMVELLPEPRAYKAGGRKGGMKPMAIQVQVQDVPTALKYAPTTKATPSVQIQQMATQASSLIGFSVADYDKPMQVEATSSKSVFKIGSLGGQTPSMKINQPTELKSYFQPSTAEKTYQQPQQKFYQPTDIGLKSYVGGGLKVYTPTDTGQKIYTGTAQKIYPAQPTATKTMFATPNIPFVGTPNIPPYRPPGQQPPFIPPSFIGGDTSGDLGFGGKYKKPKGKYQPSFIATQLGIKGKVGKSEISGFSIRPIKEGKTQKTKKGKRWWE